MGGSYDALMLRQQAQAQPGSGGQQGSGGQYTGTAVPHVGALSPSGYTMPANWVNPAVSGRDLIVHRDVLRQVASRIDALAGQIQNALGAAQGAARSPGAAGGWSEAQQLNQAMLKAYQGVTQYTAELRQAHSDTAARLILSADHYDAAEQQITTAIHAATDPTATIVESGGNDMPANPTPVQARALRLMAGGGQNWTGTFPITQDAGFAQAGTAGYTWQQVQALLAQTDPEAITAAGAAYGQLSNALTQVTGELAAHGQTLAANWGGATAVTAISQVQQLHQTATDMQANTWAAQQALSWYGPVLAAFKASPPRPATAHPADQMAANQAARQLMNALNGHAQTAYYQMPGAVNKNLPPPMARTGGTGTSGGISGGGASGGGAGGGFGGIPGGGLPGGGLPGGGLPGGGLPGGGALGGAPAGGVPGAGAPAGGFSGVPGLSGASGSVPGAGGPGVITPGVPGGVPATVPAPTQLAGLPPGGAGTITPPGPASGGAGGLGGMPPGGGGFGGFGLLPPVPGTGRGTSSGRSGLVEPLPGGALGASAPPPAELGVGVPGIAGEVVPSGGLAAFGEPVIGPAGVITSQAVPGAVEGVPGATAAGEAGVFPMMGGVPGGAGQGGIARTRQFWTAEEPGTWAASDTAAGATAEASGPAAGGGLAGESGPAGLMPAGAGGAGRDERDRIRQAWMSEEDDLWGTGQPTAPPVIGRD